MRDPEVKAKLVNGGSVWLWVIKLVRCGLSPEQALTAATSAPARVWRLSDRGRIAAGLRADLLLVRGDPTRDITSTREIEQIWLAGALVDRARLLEKIRDLQP